MDRESAEDVEKAHMEMKKFQYQYMDGDDLVVMDMKSFEQFNFNKKLGHSAFRAVTVGAQYSF